MMVFAVVEAGGTGMDVSETGMDVGETGMDVGRTEMDVGKTGMDVGRIGMDVGGIGEDSGRAEVKEDEVTAVAGNWAETVNETSSSPLLSSPPSSLSSPSLTSTAIALLIFFFLILAFFRGKIPVCSSPSKVTTHVQVVIGSVGSPEQRLILFFSRTAIPVTLDFSIIEERRETASKL